MTQAAETRGQHTPGPWDVGQNGDSCARDHVIASGPKVIAKVYGRGYPSGFGWSPDSAADARLIAAAPDLLAAVKFAERLSRATLEDLLERHPESHPLVSIERQALAEFEDAIAKATGAS